MTASSKDLQVVEPSAPVPALAVIIERLASNPKVDVGKLEKIIELQERVLAHEARASYDAAFSAMQAELPVIAERGKTDKARYATLEDIVERVRPILARYGFSLSHETQWPEDGRVRIVGTLSRGGHSRQSTFVTTADTSGSKNAVQALGSAMAYGRRYTTLDLLNIVSRFEDDDGTSASAAARPQEPEGFEAWAAAIDQIASAGVKALTEAWNTSKREYCDYATAHRRDLTARWKDTAKKARVPRG